MAVLSIAWTIAVASVAAWRNRRIAAYSVIVVKDEKVEPPNPASRVHNNDDYPITNVDLHDETWRVHNYGDYPITDVELRDETEEQIVSLADFVAPKLPSEPFVISPVRKQLVYLIYRDARGLLWKRRFRPNGQQLPKRKRNYVERTKRSWVVVKTGTKAVFRR